MGDNWPEFDTGALYGGTLGIGQYGQFVPPLQPMDWNAQSYGTYGTYGDLSVGNLGLNFDSNLPPVEGPQLVPASHQVAIPLQSNARDAANFVSESPQARIELQGKARQPPRLPEGFNYVKGGKYQTGLGAPIIDGNGQQLYISNSGRIRDIHRNPFNADGERIPLIPLLPKGVSYVKGGKFIPGLGMPITAGNGKRLYIMDDGTIQDDYEDPFYANGLPIPKKRRPYKNRPPNARQKRGDPIGDIETIEASSSTGNTTSQSQSNQFSKYLTMYYAVQANVSSLLYPFVKEIIGNTNNTLIRDVATAAFVEVVGLPIIVISPFVAGMNCLGWLEDEYFRGTNNSVAAITAKPRSNLSSDDIASLHYFSSYQTLLSVYNNVYYNGSKVANSTGLLDVLHQLQRYLIPNDTSIMSEEFKKTQNITQLFP